MNKRIKNLGIALIALGIIILVTDYIAGWSHINILQLSALAIIIAGAVVHIIYIKKDSEY